MRDFGTAQLPAWPLAIGDRVDRSQLSEETVVKTSPDALHCEFDGRVIVLHRLDRVCFTMSPLAARLWKAMCHPKRLDEVVQDAAQDGVPPAWDEVTAWVEEMMSYGLVDVDPESSAGSRSVDIEELRRAAYAQLLAVA